MKKVDETMNIVSLSPRLKHPPEERVKNPPTTDEEVVEWHLGLLQHSLKHLVERPPSRPEILAWIMSRGKAAFSFVACASVLGADPDQLRLDILRAYREKTGDAGIMPLIHNAGSIGAQTPTRAQQAGAG